MEAAADRENGGHGLRAEVSLLPLKKRALSDSSSDRGGSSDDSCSPPPKKRCVDGYVGADSKDAGDRAAARQPAEIATAEGSCAAPQPSAKKLMHDGIRSLADLNERHAAQAAAAEAAEAARDEENQQNGGGVVPRSIADGSGLGEAVRRRLVELGATRPWFVYQKNLRKSDVCRNQNRLLVSCKRETLKGCPITWCFSAEEWLRVENMQAGLLLTTLDRDAVGHTLTCKFLDSNGGYRFITGWKEFASRNGIVLDSRGRWTRDVDVELWAFRSRALELMQPKLDEDGKPRKFPKDMDKMDEEEKKKIKKEMCLPDHLHRDGSLGLILLHHERRKTHVERDDDDEDEGMGPPPRAKGKKQRDKKQGAPAGGGGGAEPSGPSDTVSTAEMASELGESRSVAAMGIMMLQRDSRARLDNVDGEHGA